MYDVLSLLFVINWNLTLEVNDVRNARNVETYGLKERRKMKRRKKKRKRGTERRRPPTETKWLKYDRNEDKIQENIALPWNSYKFNQ